MLIRASAALLIAIALTSCATRTLERQDVKSYTVGQTLSAPVGSALLTVQNGSIEKVKKWVGILNSPDGWQEETRMSTDFVRKELIYSGASGKTIELSYREYRSGLAAPAFFQNLKYDLGESSVITFQNFRFDVQSATNSGITARLLSDR